MLKDHPEKFNVAEERKFVGLDAYQKVIDSGVDVVILTTTPAFRPQHIKAAIDAGKHVFAEKPMAVDGPGLRSVLESAKKAKEKNLALVDGFSAQCLSGVTLDYKSNFQESGFAFENPNATGGCGCGSSFTV